MKESLVSAGMTGTMFMVLLLFGAVFPANAQEEDTDALLEMSFDDLMNIDISVASITAKPIREQPGIVTTITSEDISRMGARSLTDLLWLVPGFHFGMDVTGVTGIGIRGFWAYDGKVVVIVDDLELNEHLFGTYPIGNRIPVDSIKQIEIIRGPGSAMYGGNAEMAVIKITTKGADLEGGFATMNLGTSGGEVSQGYGLGYGKTFGEKLHLSIMGSYEENYRSDKNYTDGMGNRFDLGDNSDIKPRWLNFGLDYKGLSVRALYDSYHIEDQTYYGWAAIPSPYNMDFDTFAMSAQYEFKPTDWLTITPKITYNHQEPWIMEGSSLQLATLLDPDSAFGQYRNTTEQYTYNLTGVANINDNSNLLVGVEYYDLEATDKEYGDSFRGRRSIEFDSLSFFAQYELDTKFANFTVGGRYEDHSYAGGSFVPRLGITKTWDKFHIKALYSKAFRTPQVELVNLGGYTIEPETTTAYEIEAGYRFSDKTSLTMNLFYASIEDILIFDFNGDSESYANWKEVANYGLEAELRVHDEWGSLILAYSLYQNDVNAVADMATPDDDVLMGAPAHKFAFNGTYNITDALTANVNGAWISERYGPNKGGMIERFNSDLLANAYLQYTKDNWTVGLGVRNVGDERYEYVQPFSAWQPPLPDKSREYYMKAAITF